MEYEWIWYLFVNGKTIKKSENIEELKRDIVNMKLHIDTTPYYCELDTIKLLDDFSDTHEGVWFPICDVLNEENKIVDVFIVEEFYSYQDKEWENEIKRFNREVDGKNDNYENL